MHLFTYSPRNAGDPMLWAIGYNYFRVESNCFWKTGNECWLLKRDGAIFKKACPTM